MLGCACNTNGLDFIGEMTVTSSCDSISTPLWQLDYDVPAQLIFISFVCTVLHLDKMLSANQIYSFGSEEQAALILCAKLSSFVECYPPPLQVVGRGRVRCLLKSVGAIDVKQRKISMKNTVFNFIQKERSKPMPKFASV